ncbi:ABC transporter ATP-binding protein [Acidobacteriota bacterium]|jgi:putative ABC transport system ATP-binding protein
MEVIAIRNLHKTYEGKVPLHVLKGIQLTVAEGEFIAIMGPSGSGKSTLMNIIGCLDTPSTGDYILRQQDVSKLSCNELTEIRNRQIGFVFQSFNLIPRTSALDNVCMPLWYMNVPDKEARQRALEALQTMGLQDRVHHMPNEVSGGEMQRIAIARAIVTNPTIILADEPTGNLDSYTGQEILDLFLRLHSERGITMILITHSDEVGVQAEKIVRLRDGLIENIQTRTA